MRLTVHALPTRAAREDQPVERPRRRIRDAAAQPRRQIMSRLGLSVAPCAATPDAWLYAPARIRRRKADSRSVAARSRRRSR